MSEARLTRARPKLVALDLDGTLLSSDKTISERNRAAVAGLVAQGTAVVVCTGRPPRTARAFAEQLELVDLGVVYNGGAVYNFATDTAIERFDFSSETAAAAIKTLRAEHPGVMCGLETGYGWFIDRGRYDLVRGGRTPYGTEPDGVGDVLEFMRGYVTKLLVWHSDVPVRTLAGTLQGLPLHSTWSIPGLLEVVREDVNKRTALERIAADMGFKAADVAAFGDQHNDREMLAWAGFGVAMGNAEPEVKALADWVTSGCDEDGVAEVIETWL